MTKPQTAWDALDPARLLPLAPWRKMSSGFGYLLRHYWIPATKLTLRRVTSQEHPDGTSRASETRFERTMLRCDADQCVWRDRLLETDGHEGTLLRFSRPSATNELSYYNRSEQTFRVRPVPGLARWPEDEREARNQAFLCQPLLNPLLPIPVGFSWHVRNEGDYMDFTLEAANVCGDVTVLTIRREGEFYLNEYHLDGTCHDHRFKIVRRGITAYALERALILEDRTLDRVSDSSEINGLATRTIQTTLQSELP